MTWKRHVRKQSWLNFRCIMTYACTVQWKPWNTTVRIAGFWTENWHQVPQSMSAVHLIATFGECTGHEDIDRTSYWNFSGYIDAYNLLFINIINTCQQLLHVINFCQQILKFYTFGRKWIWHDLHNFGTCLPDYIASYSGRQ